MAIPSRKSSKCNIPLFFLSKTKKSLWPRSPCQLNWGKYGKQTIVRVRGNEEGRLVCPSYCRQTRQSSHQNVLATFLSSWGKFITLYVLWTYASTISKGCKHVHLVTCVAYIKSSSKCKGLARNIKRLIRQYIVINISQWFWHSLVRWSFAKHFCHLSCMPASRTVNIKLHCRLPPCRRLLVYVDVTEDSTNRYFFYLCSTGWSDV